MLSQVLLWSLLAYLVLTCYCHPSPHGDHLNQEVPTSHPAHISDHRFFLQEIFTKYGHEGKMTFEGFEHLLESLGLGNIIITDHDVSVHKEDEFRTAHDTHDHSKKNMVDGEAHHHEAKHSTASHQIRTAARKVDRTTYTSRQTTHPTMTTPVRSRVRYDHSNTLPTSVGHSSPQTESSHRTSAQPNRTSSFSNSPSVTENIYHYRLPDAGIPELLVNISSLVDQHQELVKKPQEIVIEQCLSPREILETFGINQSSSLNPVSFLHLCPAIIYELDQGHCMFRDFTHRRHKNLTTLHQWMYTLLAVLVISLCGLLSVAVIPIMQKWFYHTLLQFLVGLAVGSLSGDGLLHLMPHAMLSGDGGHGSGSLLLEVAERTAVWRGFAALGGILFFFIAERLLGVITSEKRRKPKVSETTDSSVFYNCEGRVGQKLSQYRKNSNLELSEKEALHMLNRPLAQDSSKKVPELQGHGNGHSHEVPQSVSAVAWMVIMGDGLHNFCDGLAIGAAFASGIEGGISTTVAVFCHELPHELGDFAMLLRTGMSARRALLYNVLSSGLCLAGAAVGLSLGGVTSATGWVFAVTAGIFLYVALVDMLPELTAGTSTSSSPLHQLGIQVLGISTGVSIMLVIANYEQDLQSIVS